MKELSISERTEGKTHVLDLDGEIIIGDATEKIRSKVRDCLEKGQTNLSLNMKEVEYLDSSGIGELISSLVAVQRLDGRFVLLNPNDKARQLLEISGLTDIFDVEFE